MYMLYAHIQECDPKNKSKCYLKKKKVKRVTNLYHLYRTETREGRLTNRREVEERRIHTPFAVHISRAA